MVRRTRDDEQNRQWGPPTAYRKERFYILESRRRSICLVVLGLPGGKQQPQIFHWNEHFTGTLLCRPTIYYNKIVLYAHKINCEN